MIEGDLPFSPTFAGRQRELAVLRAVLADACSGRGCFVLLIGEAGIGKTRLAEELAAAATHQGVRVVWGRCAEDEGAPPYRAWTQVLRELTPQGGPMRAGAAPAADAAAVSSILLDPGLTPTGSDGPAPESARFRFFAAVSAELRAAARHTPLLLVLEDLHRADPSSLHLLEFVARDIAGARILLVGTARGPEPPGRWSVVEMLARAPFRTLPLRGLDERDVRRLLELPGHAPSLSRFARPIHRQTEGNPFFVLEIASWLAHEDAAVRDRYAAGSGPQHAPLPVPDSVRAVIARRLDRLSADARDVLRKAAILGGTFRARLLADLAREAGEEAPDAALEEAVRAGVLREVPGSETYRFRHTLIRQALYEEVAGGAREHLHARAADALEARYGDAAGRHAAVLAHHLDRAGRFAEFDRLVAYSRLAGEQALATHAYAEAARHFERALAARGDRDVDAGYAALLFGLGRARAATSPRWNRQDAWNHLRRAAEIFLDLNDIEGAVAAATHPAITAEGATGVVDMVERVLERIEPDSLESGWLLARLGAGRFFERGEYEAAREAFGRAMGVARRSRDAALELRTLAYATAVEHFAVHWPAVLESTRRVVELAREVDDPYAENYARYRASFALTFGGRAAEGRLEARANLEHARELGDEGLLLDALYVNAALAQLRGDWEAARAIGEQGLDVSPHHLPLLHLRTVLEFEVGRVDAGDEFLDRLLDASRHAGPYPLRDAFRALVLPQIAYATGDAGRLEALETDARSGGVAGTLIAAGRALAAVLRRDARTAAAELRVLDPLAGSIAAPLLVTDRLLGLLAHTIGHVDRAAAWLETARTFCREAGYAPELGWASCDLARVLLERGHDGDADRAASLLEQALDTAERLQMRPLATCAAALRERLRAPGTTTEPHRLTPRELEVLRLVAAGGTNEQIAQQLSISVNTVAVHVARILAKTGSRNRTEAAGYALRHSLA
ncbi:MAG TPA: AAA family ATPase [Longimicrobiales bacterium]